MEHVKSLPINPYAYYLANSVSNVLYNIEKYDQSALGWPKSPEHLKPGRRVNKKPKSTTSIEIPFTHRPSRLMNRPDGDKSHSDQWAVKKSKFYKIIRDSQNPDSNRNKRKRERDYDEDSLYSDISSILETHLDQQGRFKNKNVSHESKAPIGKRLEKEIYTVRLQEPDKSDLEFRENRKNNLSNTSLSLKMYPIPTTGVVNSNLQLKSAMSNLPKTRLPMGDPNKVSAKLHFMDLYKVRQKMTEPSKKQKKNTTAKGKKHKKNTVRKHVKRSTTYDLAETFRPTRMSQRGSFKKFSLQGCMSGYLSARRSDAFVVDNRPAYMVILDDHNTRDEAPLLRLTAERNRRRLSKVSTASMSPLEDFSERLVKLQRLLSRDSIDSWIQESSSLAIDGIGDRDLLLFPYPEIFNKEASSEIKRREEATNQYPEIPTPIREMRLEQKPPTPELETKKKKKDCCSICKLIHPKEPEKEAPFMQEMRKEQTRQELLAYAANVSKSLKPQPVAQKATAHNLDIHDIQCQSYFKLEDKDIHFAKAYPLCRKPLQSNLFKISKPRICFGEIDLNSASRPRDNNCDQNI